uniref:Uncharacterized protein n=1 Tax=Anopheles culicifacies TaxID=139723 RepID=A0A182LSE0_9DIPT
MGGVQLREELHQHIVRVCTLAGIFPLRLDHTVQMADRDEIVLILLERLELGYHIVMEEAGRAEMRHRHPMHVDLKVWMFHLIQQPVLAVDCAVLNVALVVFVILSVMGVLSMLHQPEMSLRVSKISGNVNIIHINHGWFIGTKETAGEEYYHGAPYEIGAVACYTIIYAFIMVKYYEWLLVGRLQLLHVCTCR